MFKRFRVGLMGLLWFVVVGQGPSAAMAMGSSDTDKAFQQLIAKARSQGTIRVIVSLNSPFVPEGELADKGAVRKQRTAVAGSQKAVLARLRGCTVEQVRRYEYTPAIAMEVDVCGLKRLMKAPEVSAVSEDVPVPPAQLGGP